MNGTGESTRQPASAIDRIHKEGDSWYVTIPGGKTLGPYGSRAHAEASLALAQAFPATGSGAEFVDDHTTISLSFKGDDF